MSQKERDAFVAGAVFFSEGNAWQLHEIEAEARIRYPDAPQPEADPATCDCTKYNGGPCYNCLNGAHNICDNGQGKCSKAASVAKTRRWRCVNVGVPTEYTTEELVNKECPVCGGPVEEVT
jgi:hypothetical protein